MSYCLILLFCCCIFFFGASSFSFLIQCLSICGGTSDGWSSHVNLILIAQTKWTVRIHSFKSWGILKWVTLQKQKLLEFWWPHLHDLRYAITSTENKFSLFFPSDSLQTVCVSERNESMHFSLHPSTNLSSTRKVFTIPLEKMLSICTCNLAAFCFNDIICTLCLSSLLRCYLCFHYLLGFACTGRWSTVSWRKSFMMFIDETFVRTVSLYPVQLSFVFCVNALLFGKPCVRCIKWDSRLRVVHRTSPFGIVTVLLFEPSEVQQM